MARDNSWIQSLDDADLKFYAKKYREDIARAASDPTVRADLERDMRAIQHQAKKRGLTV